MAPAAPLVRFGPFEFDPRSGDLSKNGVRRPLQEQSIRLLKAFVEHPQTLLTRDELVVRMWPDAPYSDHVHALNVAIKRLRDALDDNADVPHYIQTIPKRGYRFIASIDGSEAQEPPLPSPPPPSGWTAGHTGLALIVVVTFGGFAGRQWIETPIAGAGLVKPGPWSPAMTHVPTQMTHDGGWTTDPAVSPDGRLLAYASDRGGSGHFAIWVQRLDGSQLRRLTHGAVNDREPAFSPDGTRIVFRSDRDGGGLYAVPAQGGGREERLVNGGHEPRFSPDGQFVAYWTGAAETFRCDPAINQVFVVPSSGGSPVSATAHVNGGCWPVWAPDSKHLLVTAQPRRNGPLRFVIVDLTGKTSDDIGLGGLAMKKGIRACLPRPILWAGNRLVFGGCLEGPMNLWMTTLDPYTWRLGDTAEQITGGPEDQVSASVSSSGQLFFASSSQGTGLWSVPLIAATGRVVGTARQLTQGTQLDLLPTLADDGSVAFKRHYGSDDGICLLDAKPGSLTLKVASGPALNYPSISHDGSKIAFWHANGIEVARTDGTASERVGGRGPYVPEGWAHDNLSLLYDDLAGEVSQLALLNLKTAEKRVIAARDGHPLYQARFSPDDRWISFLDVAAEHPSIWLTRVSADRPADPAAWISIVSDSAWTDKPRWSPDGRLLYFLSDRDGFRCVWAQGIEPQSGRTVGMAFAVYHAHNVSLSMMNITSPNIGFDVAHDRLVFNVGLRAGNVWTTTLEPRP